MNTINKILLAILVATATNKVFTTEATTNPTNDTNTNNKQVSAPAAGTSDEKKNTDSTVTTQTPAQKLEAEKIVKQATALALSTANEAVVKLENEMKNNKVDEKAISTDPKLVTLKETAATLKIKDEQQEAKVNTAWKEAKPWMATMYKYATGIGLGGFLIANLELTGNKATFIKGLSLVTVVAATAFVANKAYEYLFKEEVENEDEF
jgi:hypothetical protein